MTEQNLAQMEEQLAQLQEAIAQQRVQEGKNADAPYEHAEVHQAVGETLKQAIPTYEPKPMPVPVADGERPSWEDPVLAPKVQELVNVAFTESPEAAARQAEKSGDHALIDALHGALSGPLHQQLLDRQKLAPAV
jgi:hypothetical protein